MADTLSITAGSGTTVSTDQVTIAGTPQHVQIVKIIDGIDGGTGRLGLVAHDAAAAGNPVRIGVKARSTLSNVTAVASHDATDVYGDLDGTVLVRTHVPLGQLLTTRVTPTTAAAAGFTQLAATTLLRNYVTTIGIYNHGATAVFVNFLNGTTAANVFFTVGCNTKSIAHHNFNPPLRQPSTNTALGYKVNSAIGGGVYISVTGFQSKL